MYGCLIYDGTCRLGEAVATLWKQCNKQFRLQIRLVSFVTMLKSMNGNDLFRHLSTVVLRYMAMDPCRVISSSRDSCATNGVAERRAA